jgi:uncharacterized repeat protein (TIGR01451 family)
MIQFHNLITAGLRFQTASFFWQNCSAWQTRILIALAALLVAIPANAQTVVQITNSTPAAINDNTCGGGNGGPFTKLFVVTENYTVLDVDIGINITHTYRADVRMTLTGPNNVVRRITFDNGGQGNNWNDTFDDDAASAIGSHNATADDTLAPPYGHSYRPNQTFTTLENIDANGTWTLTICDDAGVDVGTFNQATLYLTRAIPTVAKSVSVVSDTISISNPKAVPSARVRYCVLITNPTTTAMANIAPSDTLPPNLTYATGSLRSGTSCAGATTVEDDDNIDAGETDPFHMAVSGSTVTGSAASFPASASFAMVFDAFVN